MQFLGITMLERSVSDVVSGFDRMVTELNDIATREVNKAAEYRAAAREATSSAEAADKEKSRATAVAAAIRKLISGN